MSNRFGDHVPVSDSARQRRHRSEDNIFALR